MTKLSVALWAASLTPRLNGIGAWIAGVDAKMAEAKAKGAELLVMPELAAVQWLSFAPQGVAHRDEMPWLAKQAPAALEGLKPLAAKHGVALLAGSMPVAADGGLRNRAHLFLPEGAVHAQDKLALTPHEAAPEGWSLKPGDTLTVVEWRGLRLATCICFDIEQPALATVLAGLELDLILVPAMTDTLSGYHRVFGCAKARAVEAQAAVCAVGTIGDTPYRTEPEANISGAAVYLPCEEYLGQTGSFAFLPPRNSDPGAGSVLIAEAIPLDELRRSRAGASDVWRGVWSADKLRVDDPRGKKKG
jgi:predicted amidohydrolase